MPTKFERAAHNSCKVTSFFKKMGKIVTAGMDFHSFF